MAEKTGSTEDTGERMRDMAEQSLAQAKRAVDEYLAAAKRTATSIEGSVQAAQTSAVDANRKAMSFAEANVDAAFDFAARLVRAKTPQEIAALQQEFARTQLEQFNRQMRELGESVTGQKR